MQSCCIQKFLGTICTSMLYFCESFKNPVDTSLNPCPAAPIIMRGKAGKNIYIILFSNYIGNDVEIFGTVVGQNSFAQFAL